MGNLVVVSMSGGLDSTTIVGKSLEEGNNVLPVNFIYGQKNSIELYCQKKLWDHFNKKYGSKILPTIEIDIEEMLGPISNYYKYLRDSGTIDEKTDLEFYTPSRNLVFSVITTMIGETIAYMKNLEKVYISLGIHKHIHYKNYWDITPDFAKKLQELLSLNDNMEIELYTPYVDKTKSDIIKDAIDMDIPYKQTWTCYEPIVELIGNKTVYKPCKKCESCIERKENGDKVGIKDINDYEIVLSNIKKS